MGGKVPAIQDSVLTRPDNDYLSNIRERHVGDDPLHGFALNCGRSDLGQFKPIDARHRGQLELGTEFCARARAHINCIVVLQISCRTESRLVISRRRVTRRINSNKPGATTLSRREAATLDRTAVPTNCRDILRSYFANPVRGTRGG